MNKILFDYSVHVHELRWFREVPDKFNPCLKSSFLIINYLFNNEDIVIYIEI